MFLTNHLNQNEGITFYLSKLLRKHNNIFLTNLKCEIDVELHLNEDRLIQWLPKISDLVGYAKDIGFTEVKVKPEGQSTIEWKQICDELQPATTQDIQKVLKACEERHNAKSDEQ